MRPISLMAALVLFVFVLAAAEPESRQGGGTAPAPSRPSAQADQQALLDRYCVTCHNDRLLTGGLSLTPLTLADVGRDAATWEKVVRRVKTGLMPPGGMPRPDRAALDSFTTGLEERLDRAAAARPDPGTRALPRMNRAEYANAVRDLLDLPIDAKALLPGDDSSEGFDNIASVLTVSPALMQAYVTAASRISRLAVGDVTMSPGVTTYTVPVGLSQTLHREGLPLGTRGGLQVQHVFPLDAEYEIRIGRAGAPFTLVAVGGDEAIEVTLNGERVQLLGGRGAGRGGGAAAPGGGGARGAGSAGARGAGDAPPAPGGGARGAGGAAAAAGRGGRGAGGGGALRIRVPAGPQTIGAAVVRQANARGVDDLFSELNISAGVQSITIDGPFNPTGVGDTPSRRRIFTCRPARPGEEDACARQLLTTLASRALRRAVAADDPTLTILLDFYRTGHASRGFEAGIQSALARLLVDPQFIFRFEREPRNLSNGATYRVSGEALASRLSFFLWSSIPDEELLAAARSGQLGTRAVLERQTRRMLADPRARALVENVAGQWLMLRQLDAVTPSTKAFDGNLRHAFRRETELLFETILREDRSVLDLLDADFTFVDERLARHYGIPNVRGSRFRRIAIADETRRGLLGHGSLLTVTSAANRTSPVKRGQWVLENLLGAPVPLPPPGVEASLEEAVGHDAAPASLRQRLERHRASPSCASCHAIMDPIGFALEPFDLIGAWRDTDGGVPVDATGRLADGTTLDGPASLRRALLDRREAFVTTTAEKLLTYALGRPVEYFDMPAARAIVREAARDNYRLSTLIAGVVHSTPFQRKRKEGGTP